MHLLHVGWDADPPYYVMEFLPGGSLADRLTGRTLPVSDTVGVVREVAEALVYLHGKAILHCDLKPANVLLDDHGQNPPRRFRPGAAQQRSGTGGRYAFLHGPRAGRPERAARRALRYLLARGTRVYHAHRKTALFAGVGKRGALEQPLHARAHRALQKAHRRIAAAHGAPSSCGSRSRARRHRGSMPAEGSQRSGSRTYPRFSNLSPCGSAARRESLSWSSGFWVLSRFSPRSRVWAFWPSNRRSPAQAPRLPSKPYETAEGYADLIAAVVDSNLSAVKRQVERETVDPDLVRLLGRAGGAARMSLQSRTDALQSYRTDTSTTASSPTRTHTPPSSSTHHSARILKGH